MNITDRAIADLKQITGNANDFGVPITLLAPTAETVDIIGIHVKHNTGFSLDGEMVNSKISSIGISEGFLAGYPVRDSAGEVSMRGHRVSVADSTGTVKEYKVSENYPDEKLGLIILILVDFE